MAEPPKLDEKERQARVSALLHGVEDAIKKGELEDALDKIRKVYKYDIKNMYARAFEERILVMIVQRGEKELKVKYEQQHSKLREEVDRKAQIEINRKLKEYHRQWEEETAKREEKERQAKELESKARKASLDEQKVEDEREYNALKYENRDRIEQWEKKMKLEIQTAVEKERIRLDNELAERLAAMSVRQSGPAQAPAAPAPVPAGPPSVVPVPTATVSVPAVVPESPIESKEQIEAEYTVKLLQTKEQMEQEAMARVEAERLKLHEEALEKVRQEYASTQSELQRQFEQEKNYLIEGERAKAKERLVEAYRTFIILLDVSIPREHLDALLLSLRGILGISEEEHTEIIRSVQVNSYIDTLRASWQKGKITSDEKELLAHLCDLYQISPEEHDRLTKQVKRQLGLPDESARILAIDDSKDLLVFIDYVLKKNYANIRTVESVKLAVETFKQEMPSLILCDVMMPEIGGFAFYNQIQKGEYGEEIKKVPFVFMSGCSDEYMKKIADDLGVNKYLAKPFSKETLEKTIKEMLTIEAG